MKQLLILILIEFKFYYFFNIFFNTYYFSKFLLHMYLAAKVSLLIVNSLIHQMKKKNSTTNSFVDKIPNSEERRTNTKEFFFQQGEAVLRGIRFYDMHRCLLF